MGQCMCCGRMNPCRREFFGKAPTFGLWPDMLLHCVDCKNKSHFVHEYFTLLSGTGMVRLANSPSEAARLGRIIVTDKAAFEVRLAQVRCLQRHWTPDLFERLKPSDRQKAEQQMQAYSAIVEAAKDQPMTWHEVSQAWLNHQQVTTGEVRHGPPPPPPGAPGWLTANDAHGHWSPSAEAKPMMQGAVLPPPPPPGAPPPVDLQLLSAEMLLAREQQRRLEADLPATPRWGSSGQWCR